MAHFAQIDKKTKIVLNVIRIDDNILTNNGIEPEENEQLGIDFIMQLYSDANEYIWKQTSFNGKIRGKYAGIGGIYNEELDVFLPQKWIDSWILNTATLEWDPPISQPELTEQQINDGFYYEWNEELHQSDNTKGWVLKQFEPLPE